MGNYTCVSVLFFIRDNSLKHITERTLFLTMSIDHKLLYFGQYMRKKSDFALYSASRDYATCLNVINSARSYTRFEKNYYGGDISVSRPGVVVSPP